MFRKYHTLRYDTLRNTHEVLSQGFLAQVTHQAIDMTLPSGITD